MIVIRPQGKREYVLRAERALPKERQTVFILGDLLEKDRVDVMDAVRYTTDGVVQGLGGAAEKVHRAVRATLKGWKNVTDSAGAEVEFQSDHEGRATDETLGMIPWDVMEELAAEVLAQRLPNESDLGK